MPTIEVGNPTLKLSRGRGHVLILARFAGVFNRFAVLGDQVQ